jgi:hypothetical protein
MKPVKIVLRRGEKRDRENDGRGLNLIQIYCKHICKYHSVSLLNNYYMLIKILFTWPHLVVRRLGNVVALLDTFTFQ